MKTAAIIASLTVAGSIAFAAVQVGAGNQMASARSARSTSQAGTLSEAPYLNRVVSDCSSGSQPRRWFTTVHPIGDCAAQLFQPNHLNGLNCWTSLQADIDGDGRPELMAVDGCGTPLINWGIPAPVQPLFKVASLTAPAGIGTATFSEVMDSAALIEFVGSHFKGVSPCETYGFIQITFLDVDGDGDQDAIGGIDGPFEECFFNKRFGYVWIENTGYEKPAPPVAADLNRDGQVDGADLGMLLFAWGPNR